MAFPNIDLIDIFKSVGFWSIKITKTADLIFGSLIALIVPAKKSVELSAGDIKKILVIRPGGIGDAVFILALLRKVKNLRPDLDIDVLCEKRNETVFGSQAGVCRNVYVYDRLGAFVRVSRQPYDAVIDSEQWHFLSSIVAYFLKAPVTIGFATRPLKGKLFTHPIPYDIGGHELSNFSKLFYPILKEHVQFSSIDNSFIVPQKADDWAGEEISGKGAVTLFLGASIALRRLTVEQCRFIIDQVLKDNKRVYLLGGKDVSDIGRLMASIYQSNNVVNFTGQTSLIESAGLIKHSVLFVGPDSGLMHIACAVGTPVAAIFGPGNLKKWAPLGNKHKVITENVSCSPCTFWGYTVPTCHGRYECVRKINLINIMR